MTVLLSIKPNKKRALFLAKRQLPEFVYDAVNLEGIGLTLPEVQTLLDGVTVGGHKLSDQKITLNQADAWYELFNLVEQEQFQLTKEVAKALHAKAGCEEALQWGVFRTGGVTIAGTDYVPPAAEELDALWNEMSMAAEAVSDPYENAIFVFLQMARQQFFYDVNKRMGRFMMNGLLLSKGYPAINVPFKRQLEFNQLMLAFYSSNDMAPMIAFMKSCVDQKTIDIMNE